MRAEDVVYPLLQGVADRGARSVRTALGQGGGRLDDDAWCARRWVTTQAALGVIEEVADEGVVSDGGPARDGPYAFLSSGTADRAALAISNCARAARSALTLSAGGVPSPRGGPPPQRLGLIHFRLKDRVGDDVAALEPGGRAGRSPGQPVGRDGLEFGVVR